MLQIKWTNRITNDEVFQRAKEERLLLNILKNRCPSWIGHTIRHDEFVVNILEGAIFGKKAVGRFRLKYLQQVVRNTAADKNEKNGLQQIQMKSFKDNKKRELAGCGGPPKDYQGSVPAVKQPELGVDHSPLSRAETETVEVFVSVHFVPSWRRKGILFLSILYRYRD